MSFVLEMVIKVLHASLKLLIVGGGRGAARGAARSIAERHPQSVAKGLVSVTSGLALD